MEERGKSGEKRGIREKSQLLNYDLTNVISKEGIKAGLYKAWAQIEEKNFPVSLLQH